MTASYAEETYNGLNAFAFIDGSSASHAVRWSFRPTAKVTTIAHDQIAKMGADTLEEDIRDRVQSTPQQWTMVATFADAGDQTADPSKAWPEGRKTIELGVLTASKIEAERDGPCREINFDPTILPDGVRLTDDPFPAARSAAYAKSYDLRSAEEKDYPRTATGAKP